MNDSEKIAIQKEEDFSLKRAKIKLYKDTNNNETFKIKKIVISSIIIFIIIAMILIKTINKLKANKYIYSLINENNNNKLKYDSNIKYEDYDKEIITDRIKKNSGWIIGLNEAQFINGIIRKNKLKNCLEIGVANGGSSILILNAIKDIDNSILVSLDLNKEVYNDKNKLTGYRVYKYFPELTKNWKLYTGDQPHKFLVDLNIKFDFLFLDSAHVSPGELLNFIEALPFLNENAIVVIHDLLWHFKKVISSKFYPSCIRLLPTLYGNKIFLSQTNKNVSNIGAVVLGPNQKNHYLDYFLLLLNFWEYIPTDKHIKDLRVFIKNYYKDEIYLNIFDTAVRENKKAIQKFLKYNNNLEEKKYLVSLGKKWNTTNNL